MSAVKTAYAQAKAYSTDASKIARQLNFAGIAIIWAFNIDGHIDPAMRWPAILIVTSLFLDLLHYSVGAAVWRCWARHHEKKGSQVENFPKTINYPTYTFYYLKVCAVLVAYVLLFNVLWPRLAA